MQHVMAEAGLALPIVSRNSLNETVPDGRR
jgi:hypothetical protein